MLQAHRHVNTRQTHQQDPIPFRNDQVTNSAGGYGFETDVWTSLDRFLILGTEGGTYYASEQKLTIDSANEVIKCIYLDPVRVVQRIVEISDQGRAPKNDMALFVLALVISHGSDTGKSAVRTALPRVARTGTHLFDFITYAQSQRGWGSALRKAIREWYETQKSDRLEYQLVKYRNRNGWTHRDVLRKAHPNPTRCRIETAEALRWAARNPKTSGRWNGSSEMLPLVSTFEHLRSLTGNDIIPGTRACVETHGNQLPWEALPNEALKDPDVWKDLLPHMPITALIRNLGRLSANGVLRPLSSSVDIVARALTDIEKLRKGRIHPVNVLVALRTYASGKGMRGSKKWTPVGQITDALDEAFSLSFKTLEPTGKKHLIGLDVSGSMGWNVIAGMPLTAREAAAAMSMAVLRTEPRSHVMGFSDSFVDLGLTPKMSLESVISKVSYIPFGRTDCALPMTWALQNDIDVDVFVIYTDNETWYGNIHPTQALDQYRKKKNPRAKLVVCAMTCTNFSIADPTDSGQMDVVGFDSAVPKIIADFVGQ